MPSLGRAILSLTTVLLTSAPQAYAGAITLVTERDTNVLESVAKWLRSGTTVRPRPLRIYSTYLAPE